jgi:hypothetical protein
MERGSLFFNGIIKVKKYIQATYRQLPLFIMATLFILGLLETNMAYLFLFIGGFLLFAGIWLSQAAFSFILGKYNSPTLNNWLTSPNGAIAGCSILGGSGRSAAIAGGSSVVTPSYYIGFLGFFFTYIFMNAYNLYIRPAPSGINQEKIDNRQYQAGMAMFICIALFIMFTLIRLFRFGACERPLGIVLGSGLGALFGYGWYNVLHSCGGDALSDLFGIIGRMVSANAKDENPVACVVTE